LQFSPTVKPIQRIMIGHGLLMMFVALAMGLVLWVSLLGGFEIYPGYILNFNLPGTPEAWARAHRGIPMNSLMVIAFAFAIGGLGFLARLRTCLPNFSFSQVGPTQFFMWHLTFLKTAA